MKKTTPAREQIRLLRALLRESLAVVDDLGTKTDIYLGIHDAQRRAERFERAVRTVLASRRGM